MKIIVSLFLALIFIQLCGSSCSDEQIDINSASKEELDKLSGIGPVKAEEIINSRNSKQFESVDDLINVKGIGEITLQKIREQGLACVSEEKSSEEENLQNEKVEEKNKSVEIFEETNEVIKEETPKNIELNRINLNAQTIKSDNAIENSGKNKYAIYGFVGFCILIAFLFLLKKIRFKKNEIE